LLLFAFSSCSLRREGESVEGIDNWSYQFFAAVLFIDGSGRLDWKAIE
jgi:hypothetical protein